MRVYNIHKHNANNIITIWLLVMTFGNIVLSYKNRYLCLWKHEFFAHIFIFFFRLFFHFAYIAFQVKRAIFAVVLPYLSIQMKTWYIKWKRKGSIFNSYSIFSTFYFPFFPFCIIDFKCRFFIRFITFKIFNEFSDRSWISAVEI